MDVEDNQNNAGALRNSSLQSRLEVEPSRAQEVARRELEGSCVKTQGAVFTEKRGLISHLGYSKLNDMS